MTNKYKLVPIEPSDEALMKMRDLALKSSISHHYTWIDYMRDLYAIIMLEAAPTMFSNLKALQQYNECVSQEDNLSAIERLRAFCSFAMKGDDWLDVEPFFDDVIKELKPPADVEPVAWRNPNDNHRASAFMWQQSATHNKPVFTQPPADVEPVAWRNPNDNHRASAFMWQQSATHNKPVFTQPPADVEPVAIKAQPLHWSADKDEWMDELWGMHITLDIGAYCAAWGEGDTETFETLEEAKQWCQSQADNFIKSVACKIQPPADKNAERIAELQAQKAELVKLLEAHTNSIIEVK